MPGAEFVHVDTHGRLLGRFSTTDPGSHIGAYRVMRWQLSRDMHQVTSSEMLEYRTDLVSFPDHRRG